MPRLAKCGSHLLFALKRMPTHLPRDAAVMEPSLWKSADRCCSVAVRAVICAWSYVARYSPSPPRFVSQLHVTAKHATLRYHCRWCLFIERCQLQNLYLEQCSQLDSKPPSI